MAPKLDSSEWHSITVFLNNFLNKLQLALLLVYARVKQYGG